MQVGALVSSILFVAVAAILMKVGSWLLGGLLLWFGFHKSIQVFTVPAPKPPFKHW